MEYGNPPDYKQFSRRAFWLSLLIVALVVGFIVWIVGFPWEAVKDAKDARPVPEQPEIPRPPVPENVAEGGKG